VVGAALAKVFEEIDSAFDKALATQFRRGDQEVEVVVAQVEAVKEVVKEPLRQRFTNYLEEDRRKAAAIAADVHRRTPHSATPLVEPVVAPAWDRSRDTLVSGRGLR
jgi:hypothetical protein